VIVAGFQGKPSPSTPSEGASTAPSETSPRIDGAGKAGARRDPRADAITGAVNPVRRIVTIDDESGRSVAMQKTRTLDFCLVLEGEIILVLDTEEVHLKAGGTVVQRGTNHAWSNRSTRACVVAISSHDATDEQTDERGL